MSLSAELLMHALDLGLPAGSRSPSQVELRRAVSAAYYSLFHGLIEASVDLLVPIPQPGLRERVARAFQHGEMAQVCKEFLKPNPRMPIETSLDPENLDALRLVGSDFIRLQEERHRADYDQSAVFAQVDVERLLRVASVALKIVPFLKQSNEGRVFLYALAFAKRWDR